MVTQNIQLESSDNNTLLLSGSVTSGKAIDVTALKQGTAYILVKNNGVIVGFIEITVGAARAVQTLELDKYSVTVSKNLENTETVKVTLKDQYGDVFSGDIVVENLNRPTAQASIS